MRPATAIRTSRIRMMMAVAGRTKGRIYRFLKGFPSGLEMRVTRKMSGPP